MRNLVKSFNNKIKVGLIILISLLSINQVAAQVKYQVSGKVFLEDQLSSGQHDGVKVKFFNLPDMTPEDSTESLSDGSYSINISPGYYLVRWEKSGYVPEELGGLALAADTVLNDVTLSPGQVLEVSGNVSGTWTTSYVYFVKGDIQVPAGYTLTINEGVKVKFDDSTNFDVYGTLKVLGTDDKHVTFTSLAPSPTPGDWGRLKLYAPNNVIKWLDYKWATDGINADGASNTEIEHLSIDGSLKLGANGLKLDNSSNVSIKYSNINASGDYGIYIGNPQTSIIINNTITGNYSNAAIYADNLQNGIIDSNTIAGNPNTGINSNYSNNTEIKYNTISANSHGIYIDNGSGYDASFNSIFDFSNYGIYFPNSSNCIINNNKIITDNLNAWGYAAIYTTKTAQINNNYIKINQGVYRDNVNGIYANSGTVVNDTIIVTGSYYNTSCIRILNPTSDIEIKNNYFVFNDNVWEYEFYHRNDYSAIYYSGNNSFNITIDSNYFNLQQSGKPIGISGAAYVTIRNNKFNFENSYSTSAIYSSSSSTIVKNEVLPSNSWAYPEYGFYLQGQNHIVDSNRIFVQKDALFLDGSSVTAKHNLIKATKNDAIYATNQSNLNFINNTVVGGDSVNNNNGYAFKAENLSTVVLDNNTFSGFDKGIYVDNTITNYNIKYNNLWDINRNLFSGSAMPPLIGQFVDVNANGDACDIYKNISYKPGFIAPDSSNYGLMATSNLVNAGDPAYKDPDSTVSDIGAFYHHIFVVIQHSQLASTSDTASAYTVNAIIFTPSGLPVTANLNYSVNGGDFTTVAMSGNGNTFSADIPAQPLNSVIEYYIEATDGSHTVTAPSDISAALYSFHITLFSDFSNLSAQSITDGSIKLTWNRPTPTNGTFVGFKLYKSETENFVMNDSTLLSYFPTDSLSVIDRNVEEGHTYFYQLGGLLELNGDTVESVVSDRVSGLSDNATIVRVTGQVILEGTSDHSGVQFLFEKVSPSAIQDTFVTDENGLIDKLIHVGIYNIHIKKDGYKPILIGNKFLSENTDLDTINMSIGGAVSLSGNVSGILTNDNVYFIDGDVTIPVGDTLRIEPGTEIKFRGNYRITSYGQFYAIGTEQNPIIFTSGLPAPLEGDWDRIVLHNAPKSIIKFCNFYYASNGILLDNCDGTEISYNYFDKIKLNATGIEDSTYDNNSHMKIKHNIFNGKFSIGINLDNAVHSEIDSNTIIANGEGIKLQYSHKSVLRGNIIHAPENGVLFNGVYIPNSDSVIIKNNIISDVSNRWVDDYGYQKYGIYAYSSVLIKIDRNELNGKNTDNIGIYLGSAQQFEVTNNKINNFQTSVFGSANHYAPSGSISRIDSNNVISYQFIYNQRNGHTSVKENIFSGSSFVSNSENLFISDNNITLNYSIFYNSNNIRFINNIVNCNNNYDSRIFSDSDSKTKISLINNEFKNFRHFGTVSGEDLVIKGNTFVTDLLYYGDPLAVNGGSNAQIIGNQFISRKDNSVLKLYNGSFANIYKNTFIYNKWSIDSLSSSGNGTAIEVTDNSNPIISSNLIYNFNTGINASSNVSSLKFNLINNCNTFLTGSGIPAQAGEVVTVNNNADPSDIYSNIFMDPQLVYDSTNGGYSYELKPNSPAINAGDIDSSDIDGTIVEIGAYFFNFGYLPENVKQDSTGDGYIAFSWDITETDSLQGFEPFYKLQSDADWTALPVTTNKNVVISGLTNNSVYNFKVRAVYPNGTSKYSKIVNARPGNSKMIVSTNYLIAIHGSEDVTKSFTVSNTGNKVLSYFVTNYNEHNLNHYSATIEPDSSIEVTDTLKGNVNGVNISQIILQSDDSQSKIDTINVLNGVNVPAVLTANHFTPVISSGNKFYFVVENGILDGEVLQTGDEVALFDGDNCVGSAGFNGVFPFIITAYSDSSKGFKEGDNIIVKLFDYGTNAEGNCSVNYKIGDGKFKFNSFALVSFEGTIYETFSVPLEPNRFNLISSYLMPMDMNAVNIFGRIDGLEIAYEDNGSVFIPKYGVNSIGNYDMTEGYHVFTSDSNATFSVTGKKIDAQNYSIFIHAAQFNSIPYLYDKEMYDSTAFASILDKIDIVQDDNGGVWIPSLNVNTLGNLKPLKGYQIFLNSSQDIEFSYPAQNNSNGLPKRAVMAKMKSPSHFEYVKTGISHTIVITSAQFDGHELSNGDEIGVFDNGVCVGACVWDTSRLNYISAWKGDKDLEIPGYKTGHKMNFKLYINQFDAEVEVENSSASNDEYIFESAPYSLVNITANPGLIPNKFELSQNYPNPFNPSTNITYALPKTVRISLVIYDILGRKVRTLVSNQLQSAGRYKVHWNGMDDFNSKVSSGVYFIKLKAGDFISVKKAMLLK